MYRRLHIREKMPEPLAKMIEARLAVLRPGEAVLGTAAVAYRKPRTAAALGRKTRALVFAEAALGRRIGQIPQMRGLNIANPVFANHVVVA